MICHKCGKRIPHDDPKVAEEGALCPYCGAPLLGEKPHDPDSIEVPDREEIDEEETKTGE